MTARKPRGQSLSKELADLEKKSAKVRKAAEAYSEVAQRIIDGRSHPMPCTRLTCKWHH